MNVRTRVAVVLVVVLGVFFRLHHLGTKDFWEDEVLGQIHAIGYTEGEIVTASPRMTTAADLQHYLGFRASAPTPDLRATIHALAIEDPQHPPAYYLLAHAWAQSFGPRPAVVRLLPALIGILALPAVWLLAFELFASIEAAWAAVALLAISPFFVLYSQEAREYSLWTLVLLLDGWLLLRALKRPSPAWWAAYAAMTALALNVYLLSALVMASCFAYVLCTERFRATPRTLGCFFACCAALAAVLPWVTFLRSGGSLARGMSGIVNQKLPLSLIVTVGLRNLRLIFFDLGMFRVGPVSSGAVNLVLTVLVVAVVAAAFVTLVRTRPFRIWGFIVVGLCVPIVPLVLQDVLIHGRFIYQMRYFTPAIVGVILAVAGAVTRLASAASPARLAWRARWWPAVIALFVAGGIASDAVSARATTWWNKDYEQSPVVAGVVNGARGAVIVSDYYPATMLALAYHLDPQIPVRLNLRCADCTVPDPPPRDLMRDASRYPHVFDIADTPPAPIGVAGRTDIRYVDPHPYPARATPLAMFLRIDAGAPAVPQVVR